MEKTENRVHGSNISMVRLSQKSRTKEIYCRFGQQQRGFARFSQTLFRNQNLKIFTSIQGDLNYDYGVKYGL